MRTVAIRSESESLESGLARAALSLIRNPDFAFVVGEFSTILATLETRCILDGTFKQRNQDLKNHPISQLLAHYIRNLSCADPDHSFRRAEIQCGVLAGVYATSNIDQVPVPTHSTPNRLADSDAVRNDPKYQRVVQATGRLRR